jgi:hypothetical protein
MERRKTPRSRGFWLLAGPLGAGSEPPGGVGALGALGALGVVGVVGKGQASSLTSGA